MQMSFLSSNLISHQLRKSLVISPSITLDKFLVPPFALLAPPEIPN